MSFLKKIFGGGNADKSVYSNFEEGDVIYTYEDGKYRLYKILKIDKESETLHAKGYKELAQLPAEHEINSLQVQIYHFPIALNGFSNARLLLKTQVGEEDLLGYFEYIKQTRNTAELAKYAKKYYQEAYALSDAQQHEAAIRKYSRAIDLIPTFIEAIDNRAFCKMDTGKWSEAIEDFKQSLAVNPGSLLATFSIGECYLRLNDYSNAKTYFEKAIAIAPEHEKPREFLNITLNLMQQQ